MTANLTVVPREALGTRSARKLRAEGRLPCNLQGEGKADLSFHVEQRAFEAARRAHETLYEFDGVDEDPGVVREIQYDLMGETIVHVEFKRVIRGQKTEVVVRLAFEGQSKSGVLSIQQDSVRVLCLPSKIPDSIVVSINEWEEGFVLHAKDLPLPDDCELAESDPDSVLAVLGGASSAEPEETPDEEGEPTEEGEAPADGDAPAAPDGDAPSE